MIDEIFCKLAICYHFMFQNAKKYFASHKHLKENVSYSCFNMKPKCLQLWPENQKWNLYENWEISIKTVKFLIILRQKSSPNQSFFVFDVYLWSLARVVLRFKCGTWNQHLKSYPLNVHINSLNSNSNWKDYKKHFHDFCKGDWHLCRTIRIEWVSEKNSYIHMQRAIIQFRFFICLMKRGHGC